MGNVEEQFKMKLGDGKGGKTSMAAGRQVRNAFLVYRRPDRLKDVVLGSADPRFGSLVLSSSAAAARISSKFDFILSLSAASARLCIGIAPSTACAKRWASSGCSARGGRSRGIYWRERRTRQFIEVNGRS
jgi:hypothetical protein